MLFKIPPEEYKVQPVLKQGVAPGQRFPMHGPRTGGISNTGEFAGLAHSRIAGGFAE